MQDTLARFLLPICAAVFIGCSESPTTCMANTCTAGPDTLVMSLPHSPLATGVVDTVQAKIHHNSVDAVPESLFTQVTWGSTAPTVVAVSNGIVTALQPGTATLKASYKGDTASLPVTVIPDTLTLTTSHSSLTPGQVDTARITAHHNTSEVLPTSLYSQITWGSDNASAVSVNNGIVTAHAAGVAHISASYLSAVASRALTVFGGGSPTPGLTDSILRDWRAGGARDIQTCSDSTCAFTHLGHDGPVAFTTNFDGSNTRALVFSWLKDNGLASCPPTPNVNGGQQTLDVFADAGTPYASGQIYVQYKLWMGRTATGGGSGSNGSFQNTNSEANAPGGHKWVVWFRPGSNDGRLTMEMSPSNGKVIIQAYTGGPPGGNDGAVAEGDYFGTGSTLAPWVPDSNINRINVITLWIQPETMRNAADGEMRMWVNDTLRFDVTAQHTDSTGWTGLQIGGPTWICPPQDQTMYVWDMVVWQPKP